MSFSEADRMELDSTYPSSRKWDFLPGSFREGRRFDWRSMAIYRFVMTWKKIQMPERPIFNSFFSFYFRKIEAKQNKSHRMQIRPHQEVPISEGKRQSLRKRHLLCMGEVSVQVTEPQQRPVRRPGPSQIKMCGFCRPFRACEHECMAGHQTSTSL